MDEPAYLRAVVAEAAAHKDSADVSPAEAARTIASRHDELTSSLRGHGRRDNLEVLQDIRDCHGICADELDHYIKNENGQGEAVVEALVRRSLEDFIHDRLTMDDYQFTKTGVEFAPNIEQDGKIGDVWRYGGEEVFIPITDADEDGAEDEG